MLTSELTEDAKTKETWNKKRVFAALFLLVLALVGFYLLKTKVLINSAQDRSEDKISLRMQSVESARTNIQDAVKEKINNLKEQVLGLNVIEIASSSPQVQKILNDIKALEEYPANQIKEICRKICGL